MTPRLSSRSLASVALTLAMASACTDPAAAGKCKGQRASQCNDDEAGAVGPRLSVDPPFGVGFDCTTLGCDTEKTLVVGNRGTGTLRVSIMRLTIDSSTDFTMRRTDDEALPDPEAALEIDAGDTVEIAVRYVPTDAVLDVGGITFESSNAAERYSDSVSRTDVIPVTTRQLGAPIAALGTERLDFGYVEIGTTNTLSLRITHAGTEAVLGAGPLVVEDGTSDAFHETAVGDWDTKFANPGTDLLFSVSFTPTTPDAFFGAVLVNTNDPLAPQLRVELQGTAIAEPRVAIVDPDDLVINMDRVRSGNTRTRPVTVMNLGGAPLSLGAALTSGDVFGFVVGAPTSTLLGPLQTSTFDVTLNAGVGGDVAATIDVSSNDPVAPVVTLQAIASVTEPVLAITPPAVVFAPIVIGWTAPAQTVLLDNVGVGDLTITAIEFELGSSPEIHLADVPGLPVKLSPDHEPIPISVFLTADALGPAHATLLVTSDSVPADVIRVDIDALVVTCEEGCPTAHGVPTCGSGVCEIGACEGGYHDADQFAGSGCECQEDVVGNVVEDIAPACPGLNLGGHSDDDGDFDRSGTLHSLDDVDMYYYEANDDTQLFDDDYGARVTLINPLPGLQICANFQQEGNGCGGIPTNCSTFRVDGHGQSGIFGSSDNSEDVTVWVMWAPGAQPMCGTYTVRFATDDDM